MGSLESPCRTYCRSSIESIDLKCLVFRNSVFVYANRQTDKQMDRPVDKAASLAA